MTGVRGRGDIVGSPPGPDTRRGEPQGVWTHFPPCHRLIVVKWLLAVAAMIVVAVASALGGYAVGRHRHDDKSERQTALADAQEIIGAYNHESRGKFHLVWVGKAAPHIWRFRATRNGQKRFACEQVNVKQFWHGEGTHFHGFGPIDHSLCPPLAGA